jgi:hypothetical protein
MKQLVLGLTLSVVALAEHPRLSECFKVHEMIRADSEHYWTTWTNACPYTIDAVYVMVGFADRSANEVADGVWSLHFIPPGAHRTMRFTAPGELADFTSVWKRRITGDIYEAFGREKPELSPVEMQAASVFREALVKNGTSQPRAIPVATIINDAGEGAYRYQPQTAPPTIMAVRPAVSIVDLGEGFFRTDFPDAWRAVLSPLESTLSPAPRPSFVRFVSEEKPLFQ